MNDEMNDVQQQLDGERRSGNNSSGNGGNNNGNGSKGLNDSNNDAADVMEIEINLHVLVPFCIILEKSNSFLKIEPIVASLTSRGSDMEASLEVPSVVVQYMTGFMVPEDDREVTLNLMKITAHFSKNSITQTTSIEMNEIACNILAHSSPVVVAASPPSPPPPPVFLWRNIAAYVVPCPSQEEEEEEESLYKDVPLDAAEIHAYDNPCPLIRRESIVPTMEISVHISSGCGAWISLSEL